MILSKLHGPYSSILVIAATALWFLLGGGATAPLPPSPSVAFAAPAARTSSPAASSLREHGGRVVAVRKPWWVRERGTATLAAAPLAHPAMPFSYITRARRSARCGAVNHNHSLLRCCLLLLLLLVPLLISNLHGLDWLRV